MPLWPGSAWRFRPKAEPADATPAISPEKMLVPREDRQDFATDGATGCFVDYVRALTDATLAEVERVIRSNWTTADGAPDDAFLTWSDLWQKLNPPQPSRSIPTIIQTLAQDLNRSLLHGARRKNATAKTLPATVLSGQQASTSIDQLSSEWKSEWRGLAVQWRS